MVLLIDDIIRKIKDVTGLPVYFGNAPDGRDSVVFSIRELQTDSVIRTVILTVNIISGSFESVYSRLDNIRNAVCGENNSAVLVTYTGISDTSSDRFGMFTLSAEFKAEIKGGGPHEI